MDTRQVELLGSADAAEVGRRLRAARRARGLTQAQVATTGLSAAYISRLESGQRRPTEKVLDELSDRLGVGVDELLGAARSSEVDEARLLLNYAELSLESGEPAEAEAKTTEALERLGTSAGEELLARARFLHARALEAQGRLDDAIVELEALVAGGASGLLRINAGIALSRALRESGDLTRAIEAGERILGQLGELGLEGCDEAVQLATTVAAAYFERGDTGHAMRICSAAITRAEAVGSPAARAAAYWNASAMQARRGQAAEAVPLAERALTLLGDGRDARNLARLRAELGRLQLTLEPPAVEDARGNLERAAGDLSWTSATPQDRAWVEIGLARAHYLAGDIAGAQVLIERVVAETDGHAPLLTAEAKSLEGQTHAARGDIASAAASYVAAVHVLSSIGADRGAAQLWFELAEQFDEIGMTDAARDGYKRAAASSGLRVATRSTPLARPALAKP
ncbi:MAG: helix-turn-helix domain-containing protein [Marmoricola sp.]